MLEERIQGDFRNALKQRKEVVVSTLRLLLTALKNELIARRNEPLTDDDALRVLQREAKKRKEAIALYRQGGNEAQAKKEEEELAVSKAYRPAQLSEEEVRTTVRAVCDEAHASGPGDFGVIMGKAMAVLKGKADGTMVNAIVKETLEQRMS